MCIRDRVHALQDVVDTMDEVYQASADPLGLGLGAQELAALDASGRDPGQSTASN
jgi:hypothetical protein